ncbi:MAG: LEA type 2 family protein [Haloglomus sp.]
MDNRAIERRRAILAALGVILVIAVVAFALGLVGVPSVVAVQNQFGDVNETRTVIHTDLVVNNPNPIGVQLGGTTVNYTVYMNEVEMAHGSKTGLQISSGNRTLDFRTRMLNERIPPWWVSHIRNDEVTNVTIDATVRTSILGGRSFELEQRKQVETDIISAFASNETRPVNGPESPLYDNPVLYVNETSAEWGQVTEQETPIPMEFVVYNPKVKPYTITEVGYEITMNGVAVGQGATDRPYVIQGKSTETISTTPTIDNQNLDEWWVSHLQRNQTTTLRIDFYAKVELPTGTEIRVPLNRLTYVRTFETDIFGTKNESTGNGTAAAPTPTPTPSPTEDGGGDDQTPTSTDSPGDLVGDGTATATATLTPTPTLSPVPGDTATATPGESPTATPEESPTPTPTSTPTPTPEETETDGGLLGAVARALPAVP